MRADQGTLKGYWIGNSPMMLGNELILKWTEVILKHRVYKN